MTTLPTYNQTLNNILDEVYEEADRQSLRFGQLAARANLCYTTVWRLNWRITQLPRLQTVLALVRAVGMDIQVVTRKMRRKTA